MVGGPLQHLTVLCRWECAADHVKVRDGNQHFVACQYGMKMRWRVIVKKHLDFNAVNDCDCWH